MAADLGDLTVACDRTTVRARSTVASRHTHVVAVEHRATDAVGTFQALLAPQRETVGLQQLSARWSAAADQLLRNSIRRVEVPGSASEEVDRERKDDDQRDEPCFCGCVGHGGG
jgi:hypothetical protein